LLAVSGLRISEAIKLDRQDVDFNQALLTIVLSTFLGHAHAADTYWYLSIHPELMGLATERLEQRWGADS
jgi:integrase